MEPISRDSVDFEFPEGPSGEEAVQAAPTPDEAVRPFPSLDTASTEVPTPASPPSSANGQTAKKKTVIDYTGGLSREERAIARRNKRELFISSGSNGRRRRVSKIDKLIDKMLKRQKKMTALRAARAAEYARLWSLEHPDPVVVSSTPFQEKEFGDSGSPDKALQVIGVTKDITPDFSDIVVSLALFDGDKMLFACSGVAVPPGTTRLELTRFVTSTRLVVEYNNNRSIDDHLRIDVCLPDNTHIDGFLGLYDKDIAVVTSLDPQDVCPIDLDLQAPLPSDGKIIAAARAFESGRLMVTPGLLTGDGCASWTQITEAALGGPLVDHEGKFLGVNLNIDTAGSSLFLPLTTLDERLKHFQIFTPKTMDFRGYSLPAGVSTIIPSGFWRNIKWLESVGYPMAPPLVLEFNGELLNTFEEEFGELRAWKEYPYHVSNPRSREYVWALLPRDVTKISRSVVRLASFNGSVRSFACTGLIIKWPGTEGMRPVILTSASLVRSRDDHFKIDDNLTIDVFLPPKQHAKGTLVLYHLNTNIAIISLEKGIHCIRPFDICHKEDLSKPVVAIARQIREGFLMASKGKVIHDKPSFLGGFRRYNTEVMLSTCRIKKAGIGGPLFNFDGAFVGMNHYDGSEETPFLPRCKIVEILKKEINWRIGRSLSMSTLHGVGRTNLHRKSILDDRWPVPEPYWRHGLLDMDQDDLLPLIGRQLQ